MKMGDQYSDGNGNIIRTRKKGSLRGLTSNDVIIKSDGGICTCVRISYVYSNRVRSTKSSKNDQRNIETYDCLLVRFRHQHKES